MHPFTRRSLLAGAASLPFASGAAAVQAATPGSSDVTFASKTPMRIGTVALRVRNLEAMASYYMKLLGLSVLAMSDREVRLGAGNATLVVLIGDASAHLPQQGSAGLYHTAFLMPTRTDLAHWLVHAARAGIPIGGASDHAVSEAIYLDDPEGNGIEIYSDRPPEKWVWDGDTVQMGTKRLDIDGIISLIDVRTSTYASAPDALRIGHIHLKVGDVGAAKDFYQGKIGFDPVRARDSAAFLSSGRYHHHVGLNTWESSGAGLRNPGAAGLEWFSIEVADGRIKAIEERLGGKGASLIDVPGGIETTDPWGTRVRLLPVPA